MLRKLSTSDMLVIAIIGLNTGCTHSLTPSVAHPPLSGTAALHKIKAAVPEQDLARDANGKIIPLLHSPRQLTVYLPGKNGKLHETEVREPADLARQSLSETDAALITLFRIAPQLIPAGTRLMARTTKNENYSPDRGSDPFWEVRLNAAFLNSKIWNDPQKAKLAYDAITLTADDGVMIDVAPSYLFRISILVDGKPLTLAKQ